jgi:hypothetical protein
MAQASCLNCGAPRDPDSAACRYCGVASTGPGATANLKAAPPPPIAVSVGKSQAWYRQIPGFRSASPLKAIVALGGYGTIAILFFSGLLSSNRAFSVFALGLLLAGLLITNGWGIRNWFPFFSSPSKATVGWAYSGLVALLLASCSVGLSGLASSSASSQPTGAATNPSQGPTLSPTPTVTISRSPSSAPTPTPTPKPTLTPTPTPTPVPVKSTAAPPPPPNLCGAPANPWGYNFCGGSFIYGPAQQFCSHFSCISSFWSGGGYVVECVDGLYGKSGGVSGACSRHGGVSRPLYGP